MTASLESAEQVIDSLLLDYVNEVCGQIYEGLKIRSANTGFMRFVVSNDENTVVDRLDRMTLEQLLIRIYMVNNDTTQGDPIRIREDALLRGKKLIDSMLYA